MAYVDFKNSPSEETPLTGGATGNLNIMQENGTSHGSDTKLGYTQSFLNEHIINVSNEVDEDYKVNLLKTKNLFDGLLEQGGYGLDGEKISNNDNYRNVNSVPVLPNTTYTTSINGNAQQYVMYFYNKNKIFLEAADNRTGTFTTPSNCYYVNFRCYVADYTSDFANLKIQLEEGSTATAYEAFIQNQIVVDNEKYTDTLNVGTEVDSRNRVNLLHSKNLLPNNGSTITTNGITFTKNSDGSITINGTSTARADLYIFGGTTDNGNYLKIKKGTYSFDRSNLTDGKIFFAFREKTVGTKYETLTNNGAIEAMATQDCYFYGVMIGVESGNTINNLTIYPMLNEGNTLLPYEPYVVPAIYVDNEEIYSKDNIDIYSTNEIRIGTWIDGKPIYRTVYEKNNTTAGNTSYSIAPPSNLRVITKLDIMQYTANEGSYIHDYYNSSSDYLRIFYSSQVIQVRTSKTSSYNHYITIEYTKTTD